MKIGIDVRALQWEHRYRGIGIYLANLLEAISMIDTKNEYILFGWADSKPLKGIVLNKDFKYQIRTLPKPSKSVIGQKLKNIIRRDIKIKSGEVDVFLQPDPSFGLAKGRVSSVVVAYDLIELLFKDHHYPESFVRLTQDQGLKHAMGNKLRWHLYKWHLSQFKKSRAIIAISEATKKDLVKQFDLPSQKIIVIPLASSISVSPQKKRANKLEPSILYVGAADYRKNVVALIAAFEKVKNSFPNVTLVLVGKDFGEKNIHEHSAMWKAIHNSTYKKDIHIKSYVSKSELVKLYKSASVFVYPSLYEGFGMPILEAMSCGCPVISYSNSSISEVAGKAALLVKTGSDLSIPITKLLRDSKLQEELINDGKIQAKRFSWKQTAKDTLKVLEEIKK